MVGPIRTLRKPATSLVVVANQRRDTRRRAIEAVLWVAVLLVGAFILLPSLTTLAHATKEEKVALQRATQEEADMNAAAKDLEFIVSDPLTDQNLIQIHSLSEKND